MITKRTLLKWRKEALWKRDRVADNVTISYSDYPELCERILRLTQILIDQKLMEGK